MSLKQENLERAAADPQDLAAVLVDIVNKTRQDRRALSLLGKTTKLGEEHGELCEAVLVACGEIVKPNKVTSTMEEAADVIMVALDICASVYHSLEDEQLIEELTKMIKHKTVKWERLMDIDGDRQ